jgi:hypothetical protein
VEARQKDVQERAERVDVGRGRDRASGDLLRGRVLGRQRAPALARQGGRLARGVLSAEQLGDPEVEEPDPSVLTDQDVRGLDVAVHDEARVGMGDRRAHVEEEPQPLFDAEPEFVAVAVDRPSRDVLEDEVRLAAGRHPGVVKPRDVRMREARQDAALAAKALLADATDEADVQQLHGRLRVEAPVAPPGEPDAAHPALADGGDQRVSAERQPGEGSRREFGRDLEEPPDGGIGAGGEQLAQVARDLRRLRVERLEQRLAVGAGQLQRTVEVRPDRDPARAAQPRHAESSERLTRARTSGSRRAGTAAPSPTASARSAV